MDHLSGISRLAGEGAVIIVVGKREYEAIVDTLEYLREQIKLLSPAAGSAAFVPEAEVVREFGVSARTLRRLRDDGAIGYTRGPGRRKGYSYFYLRGDIERYLTKRQRRATRP